MVLCCWQSLVFQNQNNVDSTKNPRLAGGIQDFSQAYFFISKSLVFGLKVKEIIFCFYLCLQGLFLIFFVIIVGTVHTTSANFNIVLLLFFCSQLVKKNQTVFFSDGVIWQTLKKNFQNLALSHVLTPPAVAHVAMARVLGEACVVCFPRLTFHDP